MLEKKKVGFFRNLFAGTLFFSKSKFKNALGVEIITTFTKVILGGETVFWAKNVVFCPKTWFLLLGDLQVEMNLGFRNLHLGMYWTQKTSQLSQRSSWVQKLFFVPKTLFFAQKHSFVVTLFTMGRVARRGMRPGFRGRK